MSAKKEAKPRPSKQPRERRRSPPPASGKQTKVKRLSPLEVQLRKALAEMGLARARRVFAQVEASFED